MFSLLYVSQSLIDANRADAEIAAIVAVALERNAAADITGALLFTGKRFAQILEGHATAVRQLMTRIESDPRHTDVTIIQQEATTIRRFDGWSMAYSGRATFASRAVERALGERDQESGLGVGNLIRLLQELARPAPMPGE